MLKSLELFGFKSFADRTVFDFPAGITGVVGPNGSGKSNVVDSIKWILGDQSAKSLRGKEMTDVIFNGSSGRAGSQFAEATLTFDNRSRFIPLELDEVSVGRRLWQSGDSEYLLNGGTARLKDIRELFSGTGAGAAAWCIIEQGRVDQILQSNAANRRLIFEEAAGVSRLRTKRTESLKRLERVEQNLTRLADLVEEVETQVNAVRSQAQRATRYQAAARELESLWVGLAADDYRRESVQRDALRREHGVSAERLAQLKSDQQQALAEVQLVERELGEVDERLRGLEQSRSDVRSRLASLEATQRYQISRESELESDLQRLSRQQLLLRQRVQESELEQSTLESSLTTERSSCERRRRQMQAAEQEIGVVQQSLSAARTQASIRREEQLRQLQINSGMTSELGVLRNQVRQTMARREVLRQRSVELGGETEGYQRSVPHLQQRLEQARLDLQGAEEAADLLLSERERLLGERSDGQQSLADLREQRSGLLARRTVLEDLEDRQEGFGIGVREILRRAEESSMEPWNQILGSVADLLDVDMEQAALLEIALSGRAQLLVVTRLQPLIDYLN
ncbi:MAG TPA: chromosome segregation protein SMC, partial [Planctomycetaceae bacterium]|nr:chromosome segregation protein SMC [Planctomycetaceae bacterium]